MRGLPGKSQERSQNNGLMQNKKEQTFSADDYEAKFLEMAKKMRLKQEKTVPGSFPDFVLHRGLEADPNESWQLLAGDQNHWQAGYSSPSFTRSGQIKDLEKHSSAEMFLLINGHITLILDDGHSERKLILEPMKPVMVTDWHRAYCPDGPHSGTALVVERDSFTTVTRPRRMGAK